MYTFTNMNRLRIFAADVTTEVGGNVQITCNAGMVMWSEDGSTYIASTKAYEDAGQVIPDYAYFGGDGIPYNWDCSVRSRLGLK